MKMKNLYLRDIIEKCDGILIKGDLNTPLINFSKDTRTIVDGDVYVGILGEKLDGSIYYKDAFIKGAIGCILNENIEIDKDVLNNIPGFVVLVKDTIKCLQILASIKRDMYDIPVIGVTGSVGKTSTKDIIASVLSKKYKVLKTIGNYNNHIGVPLTILGLKDETAMVVEMGMNNLGEISVLSKIAKPTVSVITNVGTAHIGNLGSRENILKAKLEILDGMMDEGILVINNDNDMLHNYYLNNLDKNIKTFGIVNDSECQCKNIVLEEDSSSYDYLDNKIKINVPGEAFVLNSLCAILIGKIFDINIDDIKGGIENFSLTKRRMQIEQFDGITIINDCYNANYDSMNMAIKYLGSLTEKRKISVLGDMLELGSFSESLHRLVGKSVYDNKIDILITVGNNSKYIGDELVKLGFNKNNVYAFDNNREAIDKINELKKKNDAILIKSSFGMNFIEIYEGIKK